MENIVFIDRPPARRFVILAVPRCGSNMLCTMLDAHPSILCHHELFNPRGIFVALSRRGTDYDLGTMGERDADPIGFVERLWLKPLGFPCVGFKLTYRQNETLFPWLLAEKSIAKIVLRRRNRLRTYVSSLISERLDEWEVYRKEDLTRQRPRVEVDPEQFLERAAFNEAHYGEIRTALEESGQDRLETFYEELPELGEQNRILRFLGQEPTAKTLQASSIRQNPQELRDLVVNFDALANALDGSEFESELRSG